MCGCLCVITGGAGETLVTDATTLALQVVRHSNRVEICATLGHEVEHFSEVRIGPHLVLLLLLCDDDV